MLDPLDNPDDCTRTGHFVFRVWRKDSETWNWRLRVEAIASGEWGVFDSLQDALWFMREHMAVDEDGEASSDGCADVLGNCSEWRGDRADPVEPVG